MDGPSISSGGGGVEIASGFVSINADLSGLRAAEQEAREIYGRITGMGGSANPNMGSAGTQSAMLSLRIDESALRGQVEAAVKAIGPIRLPVELVMPTGGGGAVSGFGSVPFQNITQNITQDLPAATASPMRRVGGGRNSEAEEILAAMERNQAEAAARGDTAAVARLQNAMAPLQQAIGGVGPSLVAPPGVTASTAQANVNPWTTGTFAINQPSVAGSSGAWATATGIQTPQPNPWTTGISGPSPAVPLGQFASPWTTSINSSAILNPWTTATFQTNQPSVAGSSGAWATAVGMAAPQVNPWTSAAAAFASPAVAAAFVSPWTSATPNRPPLIESEPWMNDLGSLAMMQQSASGEEIAEEAEYFYRGRPATIGGISARRSTSGFTGRQFSGGGRIARNPFSPYGIGQMFGNVAGAFVAYEGLRAAMDLGGAFADAGRIESESSLNLRGFYNGETPSDFFTDPQTIFQSQQLASRQAQLRRVRGFEALPLVGGVVQFEGALSGLPRSYELRAQEAQDALSVQAKYTQLSQAVDVGQLQFQGNESGAIRARALQQLDARLAEIRQKGGTLEAQDQEGSAAARDYALSLEQSRRARAVYQSQFADIGGLQISAFSARTLATLGPGSIAEAERLRFAGEQEDIKTQRDQAMAAARNPAEKLHAEQQGNLRLNIATSTEDLERKNRIRQEESEIGGIRAQADAAMLRARGDAFAAELRLYQQHASDVRRAVQGLSTDQIKIAEDALAVERNAIGIAQSREMTNAFGTAVVQGQVAGFQVQAADLRTQGDRFGAQMLEFQERRIVLEQERIQARQLPWYQRVPREIELFGQGMVLSAEQREAAAFHQRQNSEEMFSLQGRERAARDISADMPVAARAESAVTSARLEYDQLRHHTNDPRILREARSAIAAELEAQRHELIGQRGGGVAIDMSLANAVLLPPGLDLTQHLADVQRAGTVLQRGIGAVRSGEAIPVVPNLPGNSSGGEQTQLMQDAKDAIKQFVSAVQKLADAKGVAMFN